MKSTPDRSAPAKFNFLPGSWNARDRFAPVRFAFVKFAPVRFARCRFARSGSLS